MIARIIMVSPLNSEHLRGGVCVCVCVCVVCVCAGGGGGGVYYSEMSAIQRVPKKGGQT